MKKQYISFSGGYDSTYALLQLCKQSSENNPVQVIYAEHDCLPKNQAKLEKIACKRIIDELRKRHYFIEELVMETNVNIRPNNYRWIQPIWWINAVIQLAETNSVLTFGYIVGDQFWTIKDDVELAIKSLSNIMGKTLICNFPNQLIEKTVIFKELEKEKLLDLCWTCDTPKKKGRKYIPCDKCEKCIEKKVTEYKIKLQNNSNIEHTKN